MSPTDVLIITALKEEYDEARRVDAGAVDEWTVEPNAAGLDVAFRTYQAGDGRTIRISLTWAPRMRATSTAVTASPLIDQLKPQCLAMSGVCAGRRSKVHPGDVIIGSTLYTYDTGALTVEYDDQGQPHERFKADPNPYQLNERWLHRAQGFRLPADAPWLEERPPTLETQGNWLLARLRAGADPLKDPEERKLRCPAWDRTIGRLRKHKWIKRGAPLTLTSAGRAHIDDVLLCYPDGLPKELVLRVLVAPIATGNNVMRDPLLFDRLSDSMREVLGVDMEAAAIAHVAHARPIPWVVMKAAMDHADDDKDDQFKKFASRASAECLIKFLRDNLPAEGIKLDRIPELVALGKLPRTGPLLIGREAELRMLDSAWDSPERRQVMTFVAFGGTGKTSLVNRWLADLAPGYGGARRVLGWSFYSQGTGFERSDSADVFMVWALRKLGDPNPSAGMPFDKAERLANLLRQERTILVLDGVEPLQYPPGPEEGQFKDKALATLLRELCASHSGLCVVTSRLRLADLDQYEGRAAETRDLGQLGEDAGAELLRLLGTYGSEEELRQAAREFGGHALALTLLGQYLKDACEGDVRRRGDVGPLENEEIRGGHARRVMASYERWFKEGPERDLLQVLGLFDRPARALALAAVRAAPAIAGLTEHLTGLNEMDWNKVVSRLRRARLLEEADLREPGSIDAHPLVREHFGEALRNSRPAAWREGHRRLYEYYNSAAQKVADTLEELWPLYAAVSHGCHAGLHQEALDEVYFQRISRGAEAYSTNKLGAFGANLAALAGFFAVPWNQPVDSLTAAARSWVLSEAGFDLRALGRLREAVAPMAAALAAHVAREDWKNAAIGASNLSELHLTLGEITSAVAYAEQSVELADQSDEAEEQISNHTTLANVHHQLGYCDEAERRFAEAEAMQRNWHPNEPLLYSLRGYQYCDLLLSRGAIADVFKRAVHALAIAERNHWLVGIALDHLSLGRAHLIRTREGHAANRHLANSHLSQAVAGLRQAGHQHLLPHGILARAEFYLFINDFTRARADIDEVLVIATRGSMRLHEADGHLGYARLHLATGDRTAARDHLERARALITSTGYARRQPELDDLTAQFDRIAPAS